MILERDDELAALSGVVEELESIGGRVVLVRGEAGIGKTALIQRFFEDVGGRASVLVGACDDLLTPQPLGPFWDVAREDPAIAAPLHHGDRQAVMEALLALMARRPRPTVLVLEDMQWADEATLDVVTFLGRRIARTNALLVLTYRDGEVDADHPLRQVIGGLPAQALDRLELRRLSGNAVAAMVAGGFLDADRVLALTGGNPLFVTEVLASGIEEVPSSVQESVLARVARLTPEARDFLRLVSVVPGGADHALIDELLGPEAPEARTCVHLGLLQVDGEGVSFSHELQRRAVESSLTTDERRHLNHRVLAALAEREEPARLAHHAQQADDADALAAFGPRAARAAVASGSHREAVAHFRMLEGHVDRLEPADRAELLEDWSRQEALLGDERAVHLVTEAIALRRELGEPVALARVLTAAVSIYERNTLTADASACAEEAVALLERGPPSGPLASALTQHAWLHFMRGTDDRRASALANEAVRIAELVGSELAAVRAMMWKGAIAHNQGDRAGFSLVEEAHQRALRGGFRYEETMALINLAGMSGDVREIARAADLAQRARDTAARHELRSLEAYAQAMHAEILLWQGHWERSEDVATDALDGRSHAANVAWRVLGQLQARRGRAEATGILERLWAYAEGSGELQLMDPAASVMAEYAWLTDDRDEGRLAVVTATVDQGLRTGAPWPSGALAFWAWKLGLLDSVPEHTPEHYRGIVEGRPQAAVAFWETRGAPYEAAVALLHGGVDEQLAAIEVFEGLGAAAAADRVRRSLREHGVSPPRGRSVTTRSHAVGLTSRQAEVLDLLAEGLTNTEIADRLFISHRTVENHVAAVLMKFDVPDRHEAVRAALDLGLLGA